MKRKTLGAFTLVEILITLSIVGIVAAATIPAVVTHLQMQEYVSKLKKAQNTLTDAISLGVMQHGPMDFWDWGAVNTTTFFTTHLRPHFTMMQDCGTTNNACFATAYTRLNNTAYTSMSPNDANAYRFMSQDGISFSFHRRNGHASGTCNAATGSNVCSGGSAVIIHVDLNGPKPPNQLGRDLFLFAIYPEGPTRDVALASGLRAAGAFAFDSGTALTTTTTNATFGCAPNITGTAAGAYCAAKVLADDAMKY
ncbi:fimbrial protein pilin [Candidatus Gastranaerophilus sp. (ex Termes propinquus)]|nr:fimbrial protein pilin [Candidatus Gastranaerophilus sp. (ex Termes propinquus)]